MAASKFLPLLSLSLIFVLGVRAQVQTPPTNITTGFVRFANATRQVSWFYTQGGLVAYDGDVVFGTVAEFERALINVTYTSEPERLSTKRRSYPPSLDSIVKRANSIFPGSSGLWPGGQVFYRYFDSDTESKLKVYVEGALKAWANEVPCISFVKLSNNNDPNGSNGIVTIKAHNPNVFYCSASQNYDSTKSLWMELDTGGGCGIPEVTHEWGM
ncbi:hypothetical protein OEA41_007166 [Lepraria neglecta]|uniref:Uncharacterized protein n=1 Tax=Lepraria neglecta TaxID=209136 RepID=A0AAE0DMS7_9LECA|nr:hypothetical protein OEA41_007166 [Lepraria neglecta]